MEQSQFSFKANHSTLIQVYAPTTKAEEAEVHWFYEFLQHFLEWTPKKRKRKERYSFHHRGLECKGRKSRDTYNNRQIWPFSTKWIMAMINRVLSRKRTGHSKHLFLTTHETIKYGHLQIINPEIRLIVFFAAKDGKLYSVNKNKTWNWLRLRSWTPYFKSQT